jgi:O-antigen ligase
MAIRGDRSFQETESSSDERLAAWDCSWDCLKHAPWGAGTGDIKHVLMACYTAKGATAAIQHRLNSHSQVLQSGVALGWPGFLLVCALMFVPPAIGIVRKDPFLAIFALLFIINGAIESVLEVQAGVVFFILFLVVLSQRPTTPSRATLARP